MPRQLINSIHVSDIVVTENVRRYGYNGDLVEYVGEAPRGTLSSQARWTINKLTYSGNFVTLQESALEVTWDNRASESYA